MSVFSTLVQWECTHQSPRAKDPRRNVHTGSVVLLAFVDRFNVAVAKPG